MSEAFGIGMWLMAQHLGRSFTPLVRSHNFHGMKQEFHRHVFLVRNIVGLGLRYVALWLRVNHYRL